MTRQFKPLALRNTGDMNWKKFFYRLIAPMRATRSAPRQSCAERDDFEGCFGEELGKPLLARTRRAAEAG